MIKRISSTDSCFLALSLFLILGSCSLVERNPSYEINAQYNVSINRDFWGIPYIKGQTDQV